MTSAFGTATVLGVYIKRATCKTIAITKTDVI